jgi:hypothetical protein
MRKIIIVLVISLLAGCGIDSLSNANTKATRVFIRDGGKTVTTYELGDNGRIRKSSTEDRYGVSVTRQYSYDDQNELVSVTRQISTTRAETLFITHETDQSRNNRLSKTTKTVLGTGGASTMGIQYFYTEDGKLDGIMQTDSNGNIQTKSAEE